MHNFNFRLCNIFNFLNYIYRTFILQPFGNKTSVGTWISAYVAIDPSGLVGENREVYADLRFLIYSKAKDQYWTSMGMLFQYKKNYLYQVFFF